MLIISQNLEIWIAQGLFGFSDFVHYVHRCTHCLHHPNYKEVLVQQVESLRRFQARFEVLHRLHLNQMDLCFLALGKSLGCSSATVFFPSCCLWILSLWAFLFLWWHWAVAHAILWIHGCWIFIYVLRRWMWRCSLTRSRSLVSSWATSLFSWWWWVQLLVMRDSYLNCPHLTPH